MDRRLGEPQSRYGRGSEEKNSQHLPGLESLIIQPVAQPYTAELSQLLLLKHTYSNNRRTKAINCALTENHAMEAYWGVKV
jgi:hypothetical protein